MQKPADSRTARKRALHAEAQARRRKRAANKVRCALVEYGPREIELLVKMNLIAPYRGNDTRAVGAAMRRLLEIVVIRPK